MSKFVKWNSLNQFHEVVKSLGHNRLYQTLVANDYKITYGLKIKLHGTNAAVRIDPDGKVTAQKRSSDLIGNADNAGFRKWVEANESYFSSLARSDGTVIVYGEWAGPGVQQNVAVNLIPEKTFFVFTLDTYLDAGSLVRIYQPNLIEERINRASMPNTVVVIPWHSQITIDFVSKEETEKTLWQLNKLTESVGEEDPFIKELYGKSGCGEGFVCYPFLGANAGVFYIDAELEHFSHFNFKAKSEHHRVNKTKAAVNFDPEKFANKNRFADAFCTEARFEQGFLEFLPEQVRTMQHTPLFIKWVCSDVYKESTTEQAETDQSWSDLSKTIASRAAIWYKAKVSTQC